MKITAIIFILLSLDVSAQRFPGKEWSVYKNSEEAGFSPDKLQEAKRYYDSVGFGAALIIHKGVVVASWGENTRRFMLASIRKSLLSALIGKAIEEKKLHLDVTLGELKIEEYSALSESEKSATLKDLLTTQSGVYLPCAFEFKGWKDLKPARGSHAPGTFWYYNNWDFNVLGTIYEQATGKEIFSAFEKEIATPLGMQDYRLMDGVKLFEPESKHAAYLFKMSSRDLARFGMLYLNKGKWNSKKIIPESWVTLSTEAHAQAYDDQYGYLWWATPVNDMPSFTAHGAGPHLLTVLPERDLVIVIRANDYIKPINDQSEKVLLSKIVDASGGTESHKPYLENLTWFEKEKPMLVKTGDINSAVAGEYKHAQFGKFVVEKNKGKLTLLAKPARFNMISLNLNEFFIEDMDIKALFVEAKDPGQKLTCQMVVRPDSRERVLQFYY